MATLATEEIAEIKWILPGYVRDGVTLVAGKPKIGKSWFVLHFVLAFVLGGTVLGVTIPARGAVLYCGLEDGKRRIKPRVSRLGHDGRLAGELHRAPQIAAGSMLAASRYLKSGLPSIPTPTRRS